MARREWRRVDRDDPEYRVHADAEAAFWQRTRGPCETSTSVDVFGRHTNRRLTGEERTPWHRVLCRHGVFRRGLSLGASSVVQDAEILQTNPELHLTVMDLSDVALARWQSALSARFPGRIETVTADLNFVTLDRAAFDLIVSSATLHHVINLEHVAAQIAHALAPDGYFFLYDYVGEARYRFSAEKRRLAETLHARAVARRRVPGRPGLMWLDDTSDRYSPFCAVRSDEILRIAAGVLAPVTLRTAGTVSGLLEFCRPLDPVPPERSFFESTLDALRAFVGTPVVPGADAESLRELLLLDDVVCDAGLLQPHTAFGVYRHSGAVGPRVR